MTAALIFGITGQDGSYLADFLLSKGYKVYGVSRRSSSNNESRISHLRNEKNFELLKGDVTDFGNVLRLIKSTKPNEIYNLAAQSHVGISFEEPYHTWTVVAGGCINILEAIRTEAPLTKFYQASSSEMFGNSHSLRVDKKYTEFSECSKNINGNACLYFTDEKKLIDEYLKQCKEGTFGKHRKDFSFIEKFQDENTPFAPTSPYAIAKLAAHNFVDLYRKSYNTYAVSGILFNHESERRGEIFVSRKITSHIGKLVAGCASNIYLDKNKNLERIEWDLDLLRKYPKLKLGNLLASRDWGHAEDYVEAMWLMIHNKISMGKLSLENPKDYVIGTGISHTVTDFVEQAFLRVNLHYINYIEVDTRLLRPSEVQYLRCCPDMANIELGWKPKIVFSDLISRMVNHDVKVNLATRLERPGLQELAEFCIPKR